MKMTWFHPRGPKLTLDQQQRLAKLKRPAAPDGTPLREQRMVVLDLETTGLHLKRDLVISIGAVTIENAAIDFSQQFECTLNRQIKFSESVLIHGIAPSELASGLPPADALLSFMEFAGDSVILAFHAPFDERMLGRALKKELGYTLQNTFLDVADLAPMLFPHAMIHRGGTRPLAAVLPYRHSAAPPCLRRCAGHGADRLDPDEPRPPPGHRTHR